MKLLGFIAGVTAVIFLISGLDLFGEDAGYVQPKTSSERLPELERRETVNAVRTSEQAIAETDTAQMTAPIPEPAIDQLEISGQDTVNKPAPDVAMNPITVANAAEHSRQASSEFTQWRVFWGPFTRESSAHRFAGDIAELSGVDTQVIRRSPSSYVVAFAYRDSKDKEEKEHILEQAIGMELVESHDD